MRGFFTFFTVFAPPAPTPLVVVAPLVFFVLPTRPVATLELRGLEVFALVVVLVVVIVFFLVEGVTASAMVERMRGRELPGWGGGLDEWRGMGLGRGGGKCTGAGASRSCHVGYLIFCCVVLRSVLISLAPRGSVYHISNRSVQFSRTLQPFCSDHASCTQPYNDAPRASKLRISRLSTKCDNNKLQTRQIPRASQIYLLHPPFSGRAIQSSVRSTQYAPHTRRRARNRLQRFKTSKIKQD